MALEPFDEKQPNIQKKYIVCSLCNNNKTRDEQNSAALRGPHTATIFWSFYQPWI